VEPASLSDCMSEIKLKQKIIDGLVSYMRYGGAIDENDPEYDPAQPASNTIRRGS
jgi:hypothetical protein